MEKSNLNMKKEDKNQYLFLIKMSFLLFCFFIYITTTNRVYGAGFQAKFSAKDQTKEKLLKLLNEDKNATKFIEMLSKSVEDMEKKNQDKKIPSISQSIKAAQIILNFNNNMYNLEKQRGNDQQQNQTHQDPNDKVANFQHNRQAPFFLMQNDRLLSFIGKDSKIYLIKPVEKDGQAFYEAVATNQIINFDGLMIENPIENDDQNKEERKQRDPYRRKKEEQYAYENDDQDEYEEYNNQNKEDRKKRDQDRGREEDQYGYRLRKQESKALIINLKEALDAVRKESEYNPKENSSTMLSALHALIYPMLKFLDLT